jgi:hypothetical protein
MPSPGGDQYVQQLRIVMGLYGELADARREINDIRDAKNRAWDGHRAKFKTNAEFAGMWRATESYRRSQVLIERERQILLEIAQANRVIDHLKFAGLAA